MQITLYDYQKEACNAVIQAQNRGIKRQLLTLATGLGKTIVFSALSGEIFKDKRILILANQSKLLQQTVDKYLFVNGAKTYNDIAILDGNYKNFTQRVLVAGIATINRDDTLFKFPRGAFDIIIVDETHMVMSATYLKTLKYFGVDVILDKKSQEKLNFDCNIKLNKHPLLLGVTATPYRNDDKNLGSLFQECVFNRDILWALSQNPPFLTPPVGIQIDTNIDISNIANNSSGDFDNDALASQIDIDYVNTLAVEAYQKLCPDEKCIVFCCNKEHAKNVCNEFNKVGISAACIDADTPLKERNRIYSELHNGTIMVFCNCLVGTTGFDEQTLQAMINLRPTQSKGLFTQMVGRVLRLHPDKQFAKIIDIAYKSNSRKIVSVEDVLQVYVEKLKAETVKTKRKNKQDTQDTWEKAIETNRYIQTDYEITISYKDMLGTKKDFVWVKSINNTRYVDFIKGEKKARLEIRPDFIDPDKFNVYFMYNGKEKVLLDQGTIFEWAFSYAESYLATNVSQKAKKLIQQDASWRKNPISDKQKEKLLKWFTDEKLCQNIATRIFIKNNKEKFMGLNSIERMTHANNKYKKEIKDIFNIISVTEEKLKLLSKGEASIIMEMCIDAFSKKIFKPYIVDNKVNVGMAARIYDQFFYKIFSQRSGNA
jgi:superfamily II DNA or RNA helicase